VGIGSRFIGGVVMESGLQLDQLCAPIIALRTYVKLTNDISVLFDRRIQTGVNTIQQILAAQRHPDTPLFETLLLPSGEPSQYAYVCYPNVLVWRALVDVGWMYERIRDVDRADEVNLLADQVRDAIWTRFVVPGPLGDMFAHSVDLQGNHILADDVEGSLQMLTYHGFCSSGDPVYRNTTAWIHSEHNPLFRPDTPPSENLVDAPAASRGSGPSLLGVINDLLTDRKDQALDFLRQAELDNGIACETVEAATGTAANGRAFASCAGYLAFGLRHALNADVPEVATLRQKRCPEETLFQPPPEMSQDSKKARL